MTVVQPIMQGHEDLAALFSRSLTLNPAVEAEPAVPAREDEQQAKINYISQHYHHSAHVARQQQQQQQQQQQRPASEPPQPEYQATESVLLGYGVDPSALSAAQLELFKTADEPQKYRLIELWSIVPPTNSNDNPALAWGSTTLEQEETLARLRWERRLHDEQPAQPDAGMAMSLDGTLVPIAPVQASDGRWQLAQSYMEPYMASGYEQLSRREYMDQEDRNAAAATAAYSLRFGSVVTPVYSAATDPVYKNTHIIDWGRQQQQAMEMENQYGALMASRETDEL